MKLTAEQKAAYLADSGKCPFCQAKSLEGGEVQCEGDKHYQNIVCAECDAEWTDVYTLSGIDELDDEFPYNLAPGDQVQWNDPANGSEEEDCSRILHIRTIRWEADWTVFVIEDVDGAVVQGWAKELS